MEYTEVIHDDEVIADSEDEGDDFPAYPGLYIAGKMDMHKTSSISTFATTNNHQFALASSISNFTAGPSAIPNYASTIKPSEQGDAEDKDPDTSIASHTGAYNEFEGVPTSIADRAKTRQRPRKPDASTSLDVIELTSDEDDFVLKPSKPKPKPKPKAKPKAKDKETERTKERTTVVPDMPMQNDQSEPPAAPRPRPKPRPKVKPSAPVSEAPEKVNEQTPIIPAAPIQTEQPEAPARPRPKPKPRPRLIIKPPNPLNEPRNSILPFPPTSTPPSNVPEIPVATSQTRPPTSQLPPSDPPIPSFSTTHGDDPNVRVPPVDYLFDSPLSSPSSLFSDDSGTKSKKQKRYIPDTDEVDELATSQSDPERVYPAPMIYDSPPRGMPPPTFFAGSTTSSIGREREAAAAAAALAQNDAGFNDTFEMDTEPAPDVVDLTMLPPTMIPPVKPKKSKKKKVDLSMFDENTGIILDEDDQDDDFDPREEGSSKKKTKAKAKDKPTKPKGKAKKVNETPDISAGKGKMEVVIDVRPQSKGKAKEKVAGANDKGKHKATSSNKDAFKSNEFIEESGDELDFFQDAADAGGRSVSASSAPATVASPALGSLSSKDHQPSPQKSPSLSILDSEMPEAAPSTSKRANGAPKKKRKSVVESEAEDDDFSFHAEHAVNETPSKKRKTEEATGKGKAKSKPKSKKGKTVVLSDEDKDDEPREAIVVKPKKLAESSKSSKKVLHSDEEEEDGKMEPEPTMYATKEIPKSVKENVTPVAPLTMSTPKPNALNRPTYTTTSEHKTPIYAKYEIAPRRSTLPMSELIRRANSMPGSPFSTAHPSTPAASTLGSSKLKSLTRPTPLAYSPLLKSSKSMLSRIASLHPNRRTPPPPPPPPLPRKKTKKELEMEERWEEEMVESVGGIEAWAVLDDAERREIRKAKWARELNGWDE